LPDGNEDADSTCGIDYRFDCGLDCKFAFGIEFGVDCRFVSAMGCGENLIVDLKLDSVDGGIDCGMDCRINCRDTESTPAFVVLLCGSDKKQ
jgi:hypothetical protein